MSEDSGRPYMTDNQFDRWSSEQRCQREVDERRREDDRRHEDNRLMHEKYEADRRYQQSLAPRTFAEASYQAYRTLKAFIGYSLFLGVCWALWGLLWLATCIQHF